MNKYRFKTIHDKNCVVAIVHDVVRQEYRFLNLDTCELFREVFKSTREAIDYMIYNPDILYFTEIN